MEMTSDTTLSIAVVLAFALGGYLIWQAIGHYREGKHLNRPSAIRHLSDPHVRLELTGFLAKQMVVGDADIRRGHVFAPVPPENLDLIAVALRNAVAALTTLENRAADSLYVRNRDGSFSLIGLDLDHLVDAARVMQRVAEDRRKSRSLYKGLTDDEMDAMTRAGMSHWLKDSGEYPEAHEVMAGLWDSTNEFKMARNVLTLLTTVKGAQNG